jgi:hypothetical protein
VSLRLDELGSLQFEQFCREILGLGRIEDADFLPWGFSLMRGEGIAVPLGSWLPGPSLVLAVWLRGGASSSKAMLQLNSIIEQAASARAVRPASMLLMTNVAGATIPPNLDGVVLGAEELWDVLRAQPETRFRLPFLLGVADHRRLIPEDAAGRSNVDVEGAAALARVFVPTRAYTHTLAVLEQHHFAVLTGPPEMGKTAIARVLALAALSDGWETHECLHPDELWQSFRRDRRQLFVADDAFGSTEYRPDTAERWALELDRVLGALDERHWLIWTSRPTPLKAALRRIHREHGVERFPQPAEIGVDAAELDPTEKALMLFRHTVASGAERPATTLVRAHGWDIVSHAHFTPERIRRFVDDRLLTLAAQAGRADIAAAVAEEIREPTPAMAASYRALAPEHRAVLLALVDMPPGPVGERELTLALRRHLPDGLGRPTAETLDRLADHFLRRIEPASVTWVHPSWRDLVIDELAADDQARRGFLHACSIQGVSLALSSGGGGSGERVLPLLQHDADWDAVTDRIVTLLPELERSETTLLLQALNDAVEAAPAPARLEVEALAGEMLTRLDTAWRTNASSTPVGLLAAWLTLAGRLRERPETPTLLIAATWIDLVPGACPDLSDPGELAELDEWLALAELLMTNAPEALQRLRFPGAQIAVLQAIIGAATELSASDLEPPTRALLLRALRRIARVVPTLDHDAYEAAAHLAQIARPASSEPEPPRHDLSPELERLLQQPLASTHHDHALVSRVLRDL